MILPAATLDLLDRQEARLQGWARIQKIARIQLHPPPTMTVSEWADKYRHLSPESSPAPGPWRTSRVPYLREPMDAASDPDVEKLVLLFGSQTAKTECLLNILGWAIHLDPGPILVALPTLPLAGDFSKDRISPMVRDTPSLTGKVSEAKSRTSENTIRKKKFDGGHLTIIGANSVAELSSRPIRRTLCDEVDRFKATSEGDAVYLIQKRTAAFWNRLNVETSTPTVKGFSRIETSFEASSQAHYFVPCPHCGEFQELEWAGVSWEDNDPETAAYICEAEECGGLIEEAHKTELLRAGEWIHDHPERRIRGFFLNALYSPFQTWTELVDEWLAIDGDREKLKAFTNTVLAEGWEEAGERLNEDSLRHRVEVYGDPVHPVAPVDVGVLTAGVDVQGDRLEVEIDGWGAGEESWLVLWAQILGDPHLPKVWKELAELLGKPIPHESGAELGVAAVCVDSGYLTSIVYDFVRPRQGSRIFATKGRGGDGRPLLSRPTKANKWKVKVYTVGTDTAKDLLFRRLQQTEPGPGYFHLPEWIDDEYLSQLTAEIAVTKWTAGVPRRVYKQIRPRNEALDLRVLNMAALSILGPAIQNNLGNLVDQVNARGVEARGAEVDGVEAGEIREELRRRRGGSGWVQGWRK